MVNLDFYEQVTHVLLNYHKKGLFETKSVTSILQAYVVLGLQSANIDKLKSKLYKYSYSNCTDTADYANQTLIWLCAVEQKWDYKSFA
jgi:hypothetical protein